MNFLRNLKNIFPDLSLESDARDYSLQVSVGEVRDVLKRLRDEMDFILLLDIVAVDLYHKDSKRQAETKRFAVIYHLLQMEEHCRLRVKVDLKKDDVLPSVVDLWCAADWSEREVAEMFGIEFSNEMHKKRLLTQNNFPGFPLRKDWKLERDYDLSETAWSDFPILADALFDEQRCRRVIDIIPSHPAIQGTFRVRAEVLDDRVKRAQVEVGMQHRGVEKIAESKMFAQFFPYAERLNFSSPCIGAIAWAKILEEALAIKLSDRVQAVRMILMELSRVMDHATGLAAMSKDLRAFGAATAFDRIREHLCQLFVSYSGSRLMTGSICLGGLNHDLPVGWVSYCLDVMSELEREIDKIDRQLTQNSSWLTFQGEGGITGAMAIEWGFTGPCLRACGMNYDLRKRSPYYFYNDVEFEVPLGINGDAYDRYLVRLHEMRQSLWIVSQVLDYIPSGAIRPSDPRLLLTENRTQRPKLDRKDLKIEPGEYYSFVESANGELGFYLVADGKSCPYRLKIRGPSFFHFQSFTHFVQDLRIDNAAALLASLNAVSGEIDR